MSVASVPLAYDLPTKIVIQQQKKNYNNNEINKQINSLRNKKL